MKFHIRGLPAQRRVYSRMQKEIIKANGESMKYAAKFLTLNGEP
jgi:hypothetical protein